MALIECSECGRQVSTTAAACPGCGASPAHTRNAAPARPPLVKTYRGTNATAMAWFQSDAKKLAAEGYVPVSQVWANGQYGCGAFLGALLLCLLVIGLIIFIYMLVVPPPGTLTVTYEYRGGASAASR